MFLFFLRSVSANTISPRNLGSNRTDLILTIVGAVMGFICIFLIVFVCYITRRRRQLNAYLEDGAGAPYSSSRQWFSRFGRYRRDAKTTPEFTEKDSASSLNEKASSVPRYLRVSLAFERDMLKLSTPAERSPAIPQTAHIHDNQQSAELYAVPLTSAPLSRTDSVRSTERYERRKVQVSPRLAPSQGQPRRKRDLLPNVFKFGGKSPLTPTGGRQPGHWQSISPDDLARRMQEKRHAVT